MQASDFFRPAGAELEVYSIDIAIDQEGDWFYQGRPIIRDDILELFYEHLEPAPDRGGFVIRWQGRCYRPQVADTPFVVTRVDRRENQGRETVELTLKHLAARETLDPAGLRVGERNVLYCRVRGGTFPARFSRPAYYQLAQWIDQDPKTGAFFLELNGVRHPIGDAPTAA